MKDITQIINSLKERDQSPKFYQYYPALFKTYYYKIKDTIIEQLSEAGYLYYCSILLTDNLIDDKKLHQLPTITYLQEETIKLLTSIYRTNSPFWKYWNKRKKEYFEAVKIEQKLKDSLEIGNFSIYKDLADKKSALGKVAIDCLHVLSDVKDSQLYHTLLKSHQEFSIGFQLYDDVKDFKEDYEKGQFNWAIHKLTNTIDVRNYDNDVFILNKLLFIRNIGQETLHLSISYFQQALNTAKTLNIKSKWIDTIQEMKQTVESYLDTTDGYMKVLKERIKIKQQTISNDYFFDYLNIQDYPIKKGLSYIKSDFIQSYADLKHIMYLSEKEGFGNRETIHVSDTFQRALLNDCLIDVSNKYKLDINQYVKKEIKYLINRRNKDVIGGWSYFPTVKEIAADIDDLGQIIQLFTKLKYHRFVKDYCTEAIKIVLTERTNSNGGFETWIIPRRNLNRIQQKQDFFNQSKWGQGPDLEVVANFVYALHMYNPNLYKLSVKHALQYIIKNQNKKGYWESRWYYGNYYGTYVCLRLIKEFKETYTKSIQQALQYITDNQNTDGGFGLVKSISSDALSTAFAILCLKLFFQKRESAIKKAENYLLSSQNKDGSWHDVDFIQPKAHDPYKSKTITTAFVLKVLSQ